MIEIILENLVKMLTERDTLDKKDFDKNLKNLKDQITEEKIFKIKGKNPEEEYNILYVSGKISTIKKIQGLDTFLVNSKGKNRIFIGDQISQKAYKQFIELKKSEVFFEHELMINLIDHELQPKFKLLTQEEKARKMNDYDISDRNLARMFKTDPIARYYNANVGDVFRIIRPSLYTGSGYHYRLVVDAPVSNLFS
tara:strand:+ start:48 stop:635 length:588 start_codon:yes stop_codon:yes gene_type:complete